MFQEIFFINGLKYQLSILKREVIQGKKLRIVNFHNTKLMRISIRWWLLLLMVKILTNLQLTVNTFSLSSPEMFFMINIFYE